MKLLWKILIPLFIIVFIIDSLLVSQNVNRQTELIRDNNRKMLENYYTIFTTYIKKQEEKLLSLAVQTANTQAVQQAFANDEREVLLELVNPDYQKLKKQGLISGQIFFKPPATTFLHMHHPLKYNTDVSAFQQMAVTINNEKKTISGIGVGIYAIPIKAGAPVEYSGKHIGAVQFTRFLDEGLLQKLKKLIPGDLAIYVPEEKKQIMKEAKFGENAPTGFLTYSSTFKKPLPIDHGIYKNVLKTGKKVTIETSSEGNSYDVLIAPLLDFKGDVSALFEISILEDKVLADIAQTRNFGLLFGIFILIISAIIIWQVIQRFISRPIGELGQFAKDISLGKLDVSVEVKSKDEIKELADSFERMRDSLKGAIKRLQARKKST